MPAASAFAATALGDGPAGAGTNGATSYEADCTSTLAGSQAAPFVEGLNVAATPDPSAATGGAFGASGTATQTIIGPVVAGLEQALAPTSIGATTTETVGSTDGTATGSFAYSHTFPSAPALGRQITGASWTSGSTTLTAAAGTFTSTDVGAFVAGPSGGGINPQSTIASVGTDGSSATLSQATTAAGTSATIGTGMNMTFSDTTFSTGTVFTTAGSPGGTANIGVVGVTGVTVNTNILNIAFGGAEGVGTSNCLLTGWQNSTTPGPAQDFETTPALPAGTTNALVLASGGHITQSGTTQAITPPAAAFVNLATTPSVTSTSLANGTVGQAYSATLAASGGSTPYTWSATGLPAGLSIDSSTGAISGTPTTAATSTVTVTVTDSLGQTASASLSLTVAPSSAPLAVTTTTLPNGTVGQVYSATLAASGGSTPYTWSQTGLPAGLTLDSSTGAISGTPTTAGTSTVMVTVTDAMAHTASASLSLTVAPSSSAPLAVTTTRLPSCHIGKPYSATLAASGGTPPYTWSTPDPTDLPPGITLSTTGTLAGTDSTQKGKFRFTVTATDSSGATANAMLSLSCHGHLKHHRDQGDQDQDDQGNQGGHGAFAGWPRLGDDS